MKPLINMTMGQFIKGQVEAHKDRPALWLGGVRWTYQELDLISDEIAAGLLAAGVKKGSHVAIWSEASPNMIFFFYALQKIGAVAVMISNRIDGIEMKALLQLADVDFLAADGSPGLAETNFHIGEQGISELRLSGRETMSRFAICDECSYSDPALILFSSGTTGDCKAVMSSHFHLVNGGIQKADALRADQNSVFCSALPLSHVFGIDVNLLCALACGGCLAMPDDTKTQSILQTIQDAKCTHFSAVPTIFLSTIAHFDISSYNLSSLQTGIVGGAFCTPEAFCAIEQALNFTLLPGLGQTEATAGITISSIDETLAIRSTTVGKFVPHMEGKIFCLETGEEKKAGEFGELGISGPLLMMGYYGAEGTSPIDENGWFHTGDIACLDSDANVVLGGRIKEIINRGGEKIIPRELESILLSDKRVSECKVVAVPDSHFGEEICACIVSDSKYGSIERQDVIDILNSKVAFFKIPKYVLFFESLPLTETGKINVAETVKLATEKMEESDEYNSLRKASTGYN